MMCICKGTLLAVHLHPDGKQIPVRRKQRRKQMQFKNLQTQTVPAIIHCNYHTYHFLQQCTRKNNSLNFIKSCIQMRKKYSLQQFQKTNKRPFFKDVHFFQILQHIQICKQYIIQLRHADVFCALTNQWCWIDSISRRKMTK